MRTLIRQGRWPVGMMLSGRQRLAKELGVSLRTVDRAVGTLVDEKLLRAEDRRGTFVASSYAGEPPESTDASSAPWTAGIVARCETDTATGELIEDYWSVGCLRACEQSLAAAGARLAFRNVELHPRASATVGSALEELRALDVDALAILNNTNQPGWDGPVGTFASTWDRPLVYVLDGPAALPCCVIHGDHRRAGADAARHLLSSGYRGILALSPFQATWAQERMAGVGEAVASHVGATSRVLSDPRTWEAWERLPAARRRRALCSLLEKGTARLPKPLAVVACHDPVALDLLDLLPELGLQPGVDLGVIGFDDLPGARHVGLTSMAPPVAALGEQAGRALADARRGRPQPSSIALPSQTVMRASTLLPEGAQPQ
jgi:DNA-binding LacI/PurR family transcriptional regulator